MSTSMDERARIESEALRADVGDLADLDAAWQRFQQARKTPAAGRARPSRRRDGARRGALAVGLTGCLAAVVTVIAIVAWRDEVHETITQTTGPASTQTETVPATATTSPATSTTGPADDVETPTTVPSSSASGWTTVSPPPLAWTRPEQVSSVAAGTRIVVLGDTANGSNTAQVLDTFTGEWTVASNGSPLPPTADANEPNGVWTGTAVVYAGASFDPVAARWSDTTFDATDPNLRTWWPVWTGTQVVFLPDGFTYDPATGATGVIGGTPANLENAPPVFTDGQIISSDGEAWWSYSAATGQWARLPTEGAPTEFQLSTAVDGDSLIVVGQSTHVTQYAPIVGGWARLPDVPLGACESSQVVASSRLVVHSGCAQSLAVLADGVWTVVPYPATDGQEQRPVCQITATSVVVFDPCANLLFRPETVATPSPTPTTAALPTTTSGVTASVSPGGAVSYLAPPPVLPMRMVGSTQLNAGDGCCLVPDVAIGDRGLVVNKSWNGIVTEMAVDGSQHDVPIDGLIGSIVYGPGHVVYGLRQGASIDDFAMVVIPLVGPRAGTTVVSSPLPITQYTELPQAPFGHGPGGIIDRVRNVNADVSSYVSDGASGAERFQAALLTCSADGNVVSDSSGHEWQLQIDRSPTAADTYVGPSPPAPTIGGDAVLWRSIGPDARPDQDFGEPTMPVVAVLHPDGTVTWWSVPDGW